MEEILDRLANAIIDGDCDKAEEAARDALAAHIPPLVAIEQGANKGMQVISDRFSKYEIFLPELILAGDAMNAALPILLESLSAAEAKGLRQGKVVIATVTGDIHDIGKNIVSALLTVNGFEVFDLGVNVEVKQIIRKAEEVKADIIALSTLLSTSLPYQKDVVRYLEDAGKRDRYFVIVGGGPVAPDWAKTIGADGYGRTAAHAVELCKRLVHECEPRMIEPLVYDFKS
jgi:corrinoid protein of di/trimethylamine methyltransferase